MKHPYRDYVAAFAALRARAHALPLGGMASVAVPSASNGPRVLIFAPHPDDECITGALPLRLLRERGARVGVVPVTLGSRIERRLERLQELRGALAFLGWELVPAGEGGWTDISIQGRSRNPENWLRAVRAMADLLARERPVVVCFPHGGDWNGTHIGTHALLMDALASLPPDFRCNVIETEFWGANAEPNLMIESSADDVADLVAALSFHVGEVARNPYHLSLPAWMADNVRRGGELVGGQGGAAPDFQFATLYRLREWNGQSLSDIFPGGRVMSVDSDLAELFG
ncbi:MAG TPA: PIG-L family deacetylase [Holophaga sp.]|nr:PIG-L family deacetylase [Holophaga sp.]